MPTYLQTTKSNVRAALAQGHTPVSQGCGMFRCTTCNMTDYLDTDANARWFEPCPTPTLMPSSSPR